MSHSQDHRQHGNSRNSKPWKNLADVYDPIKIGSIDGTDTIPHDKGICRAIYSKYTPNKNVKGKPHRTIFIAKLNFQTSEDILIEKFAVFGTIVSCRLVRDIVTGISKGYAFIEYDSSRSTYDAYKSMNMEFIDGVKILVDYEMERVLPGWKPRRLGGGFGGKKESGQLRFGCRMKPFQRPIIINMNRKINSHGDQERNNTKNNPNQKTRR